MYALVTKARTDLQKILDSSFDIICTINSDFQFVTISAASKKTWGYEPFELIGRNSMSIVVKEDRAITIERINLAKKDPLQNTCENRILKKDGSITHMSWSAHWDEDDKLLFCVGRSIDKKNVERFLVESQEQLRFAQRLARMGNWYVNLDTKQASWSEMLYEIYGFDKNEFPNPSVDIYVSMIHPDDRQIFWTDYEKLLAEGRTDSVHRLIRPDGNIIYVKHLSHVVKNERGEIIGLTGTAQDITEQKEAEIKLAISEKKFKSLVQNGSDIISIVDEKGNFKYLSPTTLAIAGYTPEELIEKNVFQMIHPDDVAQVMKKMQQVINFTRDGSPIEYRLRAKTGEWLWLESLGSNMMHEADVEGVIVTSRNVTERKRLENLLAAEQKNRQRDITSAVIKAQECERAQLGQELHDNVNQVLTTVKLYNQMLFDGLGDSKDVLQKSIHHLQYCIDEIRSISKRLSAPSLGSICLEDSIAELVDSINMTKRLQIALEIRGLEKKMVPQDFHLTIYRIIQEQLNNIIKYAEATKVSVQLCNSRDELFLQITDDGKGFDTNAKRKGIGITNMETRAENMHGKLQIISSPGKGCTLKASFPSIGQIASNIHSHATKPVSAE